MPFNVSPVAKPGAPAPAAAQETTINQPSQAALSARERALRILTGGNKAPADMPSQVLKNEEEEKPAVSASSDVVEGQADSEVGGVSEESANAEAPGVEAEAPAAKPKEDQPLSAQYAALARKEKALRTQARDLKAQQEAFKAQQEGLKSKESEYQAKYVPKERLTQDTLNVLSELGITYDQLTNQALNAPKPEERAQLQAIEDLKSQIKALRDAQDESKKTFQETQTQQYQQALNQIKRDATSLVNSDPAYEAIKETGSAGDVVDLIERTFKEDGVLMSVEEAAKAVEDYLVEEAMKLTKLNKIKQRLSAGSQTAQKQQQAAAPAKQQPQLKTLTNAVGTSRQLSARERALLAFKGELPK